jgi:hypothetical protein
MRIRPRRPSHATVVAYLALFVALGGVGAYAAEKITSKEIKKNAVRAKHIRGGAVGADELANGAVRRAALAKGSVTGEALANGAVSNAALAGDAVTGAKLDDGSLQLEDIAQVVVRGTFSPGSVAAGGCALLDPGSTAGVQPGDAVIVLAGGPPAVDWNPNFVVEAFGGVIPQLPGNFSSRVRFCNTSAGAVDPGPLPYTVLGFRLED